MIHDIEGHSTSHTCEHTHVHKVRDGVRNCNGDRIHNVRNQLDVNLFLEHTEPIWLTIKLNLELLSTFLSS